MRALRVLLVGVVGLLGTLALVTGTAGPAAACSCVIAKPAQQLRAADVVVTGVLVSMQDPPRRRLMSSLDPITYTVAVESTYKGEPQAELVFTSAMSGASCGLEGMEVDRRYTFFLTRVGPGVSRFVDAEPGDLVSGLCSGTRPSRDSLDRRLTALAGPAVLATDMDPSPAADRSPTSVEAERPDEPAAWAWPAAGGVLTVLAAAVVLVWRRRTAARP
jgi:hypothetical protein